MTVMATNRQVLFMRRARDWPINIGKPATILLVPMPNLWRRIGGGIGHEEAPELVE
jgi:hypothetical protein